MNYELFKKIREGNEDEAKELYGNLMDNLYCGAGVRIMLRNFSHSLGKNILKLREKEK